MNKMLDSTGCGSEFALFIGCNRLFTLMRIRIQILDSKKGSNPKKILTYAQIP
jgi:hypothetical protein